MASCDNCGTTIIFGGQKDGNYRFCSAKCHEAGRVLGMADQIPERTVSDQARRIFNGNCPKCKGQGPIDVRMSHSVWSAIITTSWRSTPHVVCRPCGRKSQAVDALSSLLLGWWGLPWGLIMTPVQIAKNVGGMMGSEVTAPSAQLHQQVRLWLAHEALSRATK